MNKLDFIEIKNFEIGMAIHAYNLSYLGGKDQENFHVRSTQTKSKIPPQQISQVVIHTCGGISRRLKVLGLHKQICKTLSEK
jgi:hypothetical protein